MEIFKYRKNLKLHLAKLRTEGRSLGFVPTMGALHEGHISLIRKAKTETGAVICSIFVNPTQFNDKKDLEKYPRPVEMDIAMLEAAGCDVVYIPDTGDIYPDGQEMKASFDSDGLDTRLEGASRPGHFAGVVQVVKTFLDIIEPNRMYLGQKDYQQYVILTKLVEKMKMSVTVVRCDIVREKNGLAMSSRNARLSEPVRWKAGIIYVTLRYAVSLFPLLSFAEIKNMAVDAINSVEGFKVDYFEILDAENLNVIENKNNVREIVIVTAVIVDGVRLLDNVVIG
ncbi:MAG: pantoate--beta-alanine ligase [Chitinophagales bacterium]|nr:pantoate--beta-alanine ligase [Chitinophagales bacterium]